MLDPRLKDLETLHPDMRERGDAAMPNPRRAVNPGPGLTRHQKAVARNQREVARRQKTRMALKGFDESSTDEPTDEETVPRNGQVLKYPPPALKGPPQEASLRRRGEARRRAGESVVTSDPDWTPPSSRASDVEPSLEGRRNATKTRKNPSRKKKKKKKKRKKKRNATIRQAFIDQAFTEFQHEIEQVAYRLNDIPQKYAWAIVQAVTPLAVVWEVAYNQYSPDRITEEGLLAFFAAAREWIPIVIGQVCPAELSRPTQYEVKRPQPPDWVELLRAVQAKKDWGAIQPSGLQTGPCTQEMPAVEPSAPMPLAGPSAGGKSVHVSHLDPQTAIRAASAAAGDAMDCGTEATPTRPGRLTLAVQQQQGRLHDRAVSVHDQLGRQQDQVVAGASGETRASKRCRGEDRRDDGEEQVECVSLAERARAFMSRPASRLIVAHAVEGPQHHIAFASAFASAHTHGDATTIDLQVRPGMPLPRVSAFACTVARATVWAMIEGLSEADAQAARNSKQLREVRLLTASAGAAAVFTAATNTLPNSSKSEWAISEHEDLKHIISGLTTSLRRKGVRCSVWCASTAQWPEGYEEEMVSAVGRALEMDLKRSWRLTEGGLEPREGIPEEGVSHNEAWEEWPQSLQLMINRWRAQLLRYQDGLRTRASARGPAIQGDRPSGPSAMAQLVAQLEEEMASETAPPEPGRPSDIHQAAAMDEFLDLMDNLPAVSTAGKPALAQTPWRYPTFMTMDTATLQRLPMRCWDVALGKRAITLHSRLNRLFKGMASDLAGAEVPVRRGVYAFLCLLTWMLAGDETKPRNGRLEKLLKTIFLDPEIVAMRGLDNIRGYDDTESDIRALLRERARQHIANARKKCTAQRTAEQARRQTETRALAFCKDGNCSKAVQTLTSQMGVAAASPETAAIVAPLFPHSPPPDPDMFDTDTAPRAPAEVHEVLATMTEAHQLFRARTPAEQPPSTAVVAMRTLVDTMEPIMWDVSHHIHGTKRTASPGPSALPIRWLQTLIPSVTRGDEDGWEQARSTGVMMLLAVLYARLFAGALCDSGIAYLTAATVIPLEKGRGQGADHQMSPQDQKKLDGAYAQPGTTVPQQQARKLRPIACLEHFRRVADAVVMTRLRSSLARHMACIQQGVAPGGMENVIHAVKHRVLKAMAPNAAPLYTVACDLRNAFNCASRDKLVGMLRVLAPALLPYARMTLGTPSAASIHGKGITYTFAVSTGLPQGSASSSLLFALLTAAPMMLLQARHPEVGCVAAHDDAYLIAEDPDKLHAALTELQQMMRHYGLQLNQSKTVLYSPNDDVTAQAFDAKWGPYARVRPEQGLVVLGAPVGSQRFVEREVKRTARAIQQKWQRLELSLKSKRLYYALSTAVMRHCANYILRTCSPGESEEFISIVECAMDQAFVTITTRGADRLDPEQDMAPREQAALPVKEGGIGLWKYSDYHTLAWTDSHMASFAFGEKIGRAPIDFVPPAGRGCSICSWLANTLLDALAEAKCLGTMLRTAPVPTVPINALPPHERGTELARTVHHILALPRLGAATASIYRSHNARHPGFLEPPDPSTGDGGVTALMQLRYLGVGLQSVWSKVARKAQAERFVSPEHTEGGWTQHQKAVLQTARQPGTMAVLRFNPYDQMSPLNIIESNESFAVVVRQRVGARLHKLRADSGTLVCRSCRAARGADLEVDARGLHGLHCAGGGHRIANHNLVLEGVSQMCHQAGFATDWEPRLRQWATEPPPPPPDPDGAALRHDAAQRPSGAGAAPPAARTAQPVASETLISLPITTIARPSGNGRSGAVQPMSESQAAGDRSATTAADSGTVQGTAAVRQRIANRRGDLFVRVRADGDGRGPQPRERRGLLPIVEDNLDKLLGARGYVNGESIRRQLQAARWLVDVKIQCDHPKGRAAATIKEGGAAVRAGEREKLRSYDERLLGMDLQRDCGITFVPVVISKSGVMGEYTRRFIDKLFHCVRRRRGIVSATGWRRYWTRRLSYVATREAVRQFLAAAINEAVIDYKRLMQEEVICTDQLYSSILYT